MNSIIEKIEKRIDELQKENESLMDQLLKPESKGVIITGKMLANSTAMLEINRIKLEIIRIYGE